MYYLSSYVRYADISGCITILDICSESYFALEPLASMMGKELAEGHTEAQCLKGIIRQTASDDPELAYDLASVVTTDTLMLYAARLGNTPAVILTGQSTILPKYDNQVHMQNPRAKAIYNAIQKVL
ncbi:MAG: hypothetical protein H6Q52_386 [Deltaproteobacteria bacterium]|nr:hypothetical protein [Deltaproteobacteria bacterium]